MSTPTLARLDLVAAVVYMCGPGTHKFEFETLANNPNEFVSPRLRFSEVTSAWTQSDQFADALICHSGTGARFYAVTDATWDDGAMCLITADPRTRSQTKLRASRDPRTPATGGRVIYQVGPAESTSRVLVLLVPVFKPSEESEAGDSLKGLVAKVSAPEEQDTTHAMEMPPITLPSEHTED